MHSYNIGDLVWVNRNGLKQVKIYDFAKNGSLYCASPDTGTFYISPDLAFETIDKLQQDLIQTAIYYNAE